MIVIESIGLTLLTSRRLSTPAEGAAVLRRLASYPDLMPQKCGTCDPIRAPFDPSQIDELVKDFWHPDGFNWKRRKPSQEGGSGPQDSPSMHASITIGMDDGAKYAAVLTDYLRNESIQLGAEFGKVEPSWTGKRGYTGPLDSAHFFTSPEAFEQVPGNFATAELVHYIGQLPWVTVFGPPYVRMFGAKKLLSAPAAIVEEIAPKMIYMQLTSNVTDIAADLPAYFALRRRVKDHIGPDAFFDPARGKGPYRVPKFDLEPWPKPRPLGYIDGRPVTGLLGGKPIVQTENGPRILDIQWLPPTAKPSNPQSDPL
jgi:hypothetical protein